MKTNSPSIKSIRFLGGLLLSIISIIITTLPVYATTENANELNVKFEALFRSSVASVFGSRSSVCDLQEVRSNKLRKAGIGWTLGFGCSRKGENSRRKVYSIHVTARLYAYTYNHETMALRNWRDFMASSKKSGGTNLMDTTTTHWVDKNKYIARVKQRQILWNLERRNNMHTAWLTAEAKRKFIGFRHHNDFRPDSAPLAIRVSLTVKVLDDDMARLQPRPDEAAILIADRVLEGLVGDGNKEPPKLALFDANPTYSSDRETLAKDWKKSELIRAKTARKGTTADGVSQLILRVEVSEDVPVTFKLTKENDGKILPLLDGKTVSEDGFFSSEKFYTFALYTPPETFDVLKPGEVAPKSALKPPEKRLGDHLQIRDVKVSIQPKGGDAVTKVITLARPPVVLVHGLFSDPIQTWVKTYDHGSSMAALLERAGFLPFMVNYQKTNGSEAVGSWVSDDTSQPPSAFMSNYRVVWDSPLVDYEPVTLEFGYFEKEPILSVLQKPEAARIGGIKQALKYYRETMGLAATQAIVVGHSMGGILARVWASDHYNKDYKRPENFEQGDIDRILTLNTPHFGSELMELKDALAKSWIGRESWLEWSKREIVKTVLWWFFDPERGAVRDLRPGSKALQEIGVTKVPSFAIATSATSAEIGATRKDPLKLYNSLYSFAGQIFFNNRPLLDDFVEGRFAVWEKTPGEFRKNITERFHSKDKAREGAQKTALDLTIPDNREKYKRIINQNIEENTFYWASRRDLKYKDDLSNSIRNTIILPFGALDVRMGDYNEKDYRNLELLTNKQLADSGAPQTKVSKYINDKVANNIPLEFMSILRDLIFHQDPNTDAVVRVVSQIGGIKDGSHELVERVLHSYSPWDYTVQRRVISLLKWEIGSFSKEGSKEGFQEAGQLAPRYMPSDSFVKPRVTGIRATAWSGMVPSHAVEYQKIVEKENIFILARPVNSSSTQLLKNCHVSENNMENCAAAKGMNVKGKSSSWGPQVGYIPFNQRYSKLWRTVRDPALRKRQIEKYNKETIKSTQKEHPMKPGRFFAITRALSMKTKNGTCAVLTDPDTGDAEDEVVFRCEDGSFHDWRNTTKDGKAAFDSNVPLAAALTISEERKQRLIAQPMYVLADDTSTMDPRPYLTADYDLLVIGQPFKAGKCNLVSIGSGGSDNCRPYELSEVQQAKFDSLSGVVSPWQNRLLGRINAAVKGAGYEGGLVTHHGPENQYKASPYIDYPTLVFDPGTKASKTDASAYLIRQGPPGFRDIHFKRFVTEKARLGFNIWPNPYSKGWQWEARRPFDIRTGYDPRDVSNMPPYVTEAPEPEAKPTVAGDKKSFAESPSIKEKPTPQRKSVTTQKASKNLEPTPTELVLWNNVKNSESAEELQVFLQQFPKGFFAPLARIRLKRYLSGESGPSQPAQINEQDVQSNTPALQAESTKKPEITRLRTLKLIARVQRHRNKKGQVSYGIRSALNDGAEVYEVTGMKGVLVVDVFDGGPAQKAGLVIGDVITRINQMPVRGSADLIDIAKKLKPNDLVTFSVQRRGNGTRDFANRLHELARSGSSPAAFALAIMYRYGSGVEKQYTKALRWYRQSARAGFVPAKMHLAFMYERGQGVEQSPRMAAWWIVEIMYSEIDEPLRKRILSNLQKWFGLQTRKEFQLRLREDGFYSGPTDGIMGPIAQRAVEQALGQAK